MAGDLEKAAEGFGRLPEPEDTAWTPAREKVRRILARARTARALTSLDRQDLRGWHYVLTGGVLATLSPYGFGSGMTGRWAYLSDSAGGCAAVLQRLRLILGAAGAATCSGRRHRGRHFALPSSRLANSKDREVGRLASRRHAVLRQSSHISTGYPIHHFREHEPQGRWAR
jgi:hypothetical protein